MMKVAIDVCTSPGERMNHLWPEAVIQAEDVRVVERLGAMLAPDLANPRGHLESDGSLRTQISNSLAYTLMPEVVADIFEPLFKACDIQQVSTETGIRWEFSVSPDEVMNADILFVAASRIEAKVFSWAESKVVGGVL